MKNQCAITIKNELAELGRVSRVFDGFGELHNLAEPVVNAVQVAIDEMLTNIIRYAYADAEEHKIYIEINLTEETVNLQIRDDGRPFNPFSTAPGKTDTTSILAERPIGGLGLHLITSLMDSCEYQFVDKHNCSIMKKNLI